MRRRGVGVGAIQKKKERQNAYSNRGKELETNKLAFVKQTLSEFEIKLRDFAAKHKEKINKDPEFRQQFHIMCNSIGVDPLQSSKGFWANILDVGDYYYELAVQVIDIGMRTRRSNGGIMTFSEMLNRVRSVKGRETVSSDDIKRAVEKLHVLGSGFSVITLDDGEALVLSAPTSLSSDQQILLNVANKLGFVTVAHLTQEMGWALPRCEMVITALVGAGFMWVDETHGLVCYYFPSLFGLGNSFF
jgi:ESCRT-II complex subunit VPS22